MITTDTTVDEEDENESWQEKVGSYLEIVDERLFDAITYLGKARDVTPSESLKNALVVALDEVKGVWYSLPVEGDF